MLDMLTRLFSWKVWICIFIGFIIIMWLLVGGKHQYEVEYPWNNPPPPSHHVNPPPTSHRHIVLQPTPLYESISPRAKLIQASDYININIPGPFYPAEIVIDIEPGSEPDIYPIIPVNQQFVPDWNTGSSVGEALTCGAMEELLGRSVSRDIGLPEIINPRTGRRMRLDCYDPVTGLTGEYNGQQHYKYPNVFHKSEKEFQGQLYRDQTKRELCDSTGKYLIPVPYTVDMCTSDASKPNGLNCKTSVPRHERQRRIRAYMKQQFDIYYDAISNENLD